MATPYQLVRFKAGKITFEILSKPGACLKFRQGKLGFDSVMFADEVFKNFAKGERPTNEELLTAFGTEVQQDIIIKILNDGELQLTAAERKDKVDKRHREIVSYINKYYVDPKSKLPHPVTRIENALEEMKYRVDPDVPAERQVLDIMKKLPEFLPVKKQFEIEGRLKIPTKYIGQCGGILRALCTVTSESFEGADCFMGVNIAPGDYNTLMSELQNITKGEFELEVDGGTATQSTEDDEDKPKKKAKGGRGGAAKRGGRGGSDVGTSESTRGGGGRGGKSKRT